MKPENDGNTQIRLKYKYNYTGKDKIYTNTKIHKNTNIAIGSVSQIRGGEKLDFSAKTNLFHRTKYLKSFYGGKSG